MAVWRQLRYQTSEQWIDDRGQAFRPYTHYNVGGNTKFWGSVLYRLRREDFQEIQHFDGVSPRWPIDYETLALYYDRAERMYQVRGETGTDPTEPPRGPFPYPAVPHSAGMADIVEKLRAQGLHVGAAAGRPPAREPTAASRAIPAPFACRIHAKSEADVCGSAGDREAERHALDQRPRRAADHRSRRKEGRRGRDRAGRPHGSRRGGALRRVVRCRELRRPAPAIGQQPASRGPREFVGAGGPALHGAPRDDDAGLSPVPPEPTVFQKTVAINDFTCAGPTTYPLARSSRRRTHGVAGDRRAVDTLWPTTRGLARRRLARDVRGSRRAPTIASPWSATGASVWSRPNNAAPAFVKETARILRRPASGSW
jgi:choline dehydrogenase-like flavoprotein